jgi:hypothetical protein
MDFVEGLVTSLFGFPSDWKSLPQAALQVHAKEWNDAHSTLMVSVRRLGHIVTWTSTMWHDGRAGVRSVSLHTPCLLHYGLVSPLRCRGATPLQATAECKDQGDPASSPGCSPEVFQLGVHPTDPACFLGLHPDLDPDAFLQKITVLGAHTKKSKGGEATGLDGSNPTALSAYEAAAIAVVIAILFALVGNDCEERQF